MRRRLLIVSLIAALLYLPSVPSSAGSTTPSPEPAPEATTQEQLIRAQWFIYDVNLARRDPQGYGAAHNPQINVAGISSLPPLAVNAALMSSTKTKVDAMNSRNVVNHLCGDGWGTTYCPDHLAAQAGYPINDSASNTIEAIWGGGPAGYPDAGAYLAQPAGSSHRALLFEWVDRREIGAALVADSSTSYFATHVARRQNSDLVFITGVVYDDRDADCIMDLGEGMPGVTVSAGGKSVATNAGGGYSIPVSSGTYQVTVTGGGGFSPQANGQAVVGSTNVGLDFIKGATTPIPPGCVDRWWGANRFETAVKISKATYPGGAGVVYLAAGYNFPDAVAGGPAAAAEDAPILLASTTGIPEVTRNELRRLNPSTVRILGGEAALTGGVVTQLANLLPGATIDRRWGATRYETAAMISKRAFPNGADTVYIATGEDFPDAVAAAPAAIAAGGSLLLVMADRVPDAVATELGRLNPRRIYVVGSAGAVSNSVLDQLDGYASQGAVRISGTNRYATAVAASKHAFPNGAPIVYIAVGNNYPDALTGGAATAVYKGPILLVTTTAIPAIVATELRRLGPLRIVILGGPAVVSTNVASQLSAYLP